MTTKREKGNEFQLWIRDRLQERGWLVRNFPTSIRPLKIKGKIIYVPQKNDVWGCDLIAIKEGRKMLWIQGSEDSGIKKRIKELEKYFSPQKIPYEFDIQIWIKAKSDTINIKQIHFLGIKTYIIDLGKIIRRRFYSSESVDYEY